VNGELRCRSLSDTLALAVRAGALAGVTRVSDVTRFAVPGVPVFQATRPEARSLTVSQGKGLTVTAAMVAALLESVELHGAERLPRPQAQATLAELGAETNAVWSGPRDKLAIDLNADLPRSWLAGEDLLSGRSCSLPWDLVSLDYTLGTLEYPATSAGLACGNNRTEALVAGVAEVLEHHSLALFHRLRPHERLAAQIALDSIGDSVIRTVLRRVAAAGFEVKAWSLAQHSEFPAVLCTLFARETCYDGLAPAGGSGCHASARVAFLRALLEAVQSHAGLVSGARDDLTGDDYRDPGRRGAAIMFGSLAFGDGKLDWGDLPSRECTTNEQCLEFLLGKAQAASAKPVIAYDHAPPVAGLHLAHVVAPGLLDETRRTMQLSKPIEPRAGSRAGSGRIVFAGPSLAGITIPAGIELRPPARCGDLAALLDSPPAAVGLIDGVFKNAPTVWHKEIMALLACGTRVVGGASLGALRAAELERFGMEGVGEIFRACRGGFLARDDAVMLVHAPAEYGCAPLSLPLVDAEYALWQAELPARARRMMQRVVRSLPFETRSWRCAIEEYEQRTNEDFPVSIGALEAMPSLKLHDAALVLQAVAEVGPPGAKRPMPPLTSHLWALLARSAPAFCAAPN
jgi:YcaO-like protein with predicted kinase domain